MSPLSEADQFLLDQVRAGEAEGWSQLVSRHEGRLLAFAQRQLGNRADAEDLVQETFVGFLNNLARFRAEASIETYLFTILRRRIIDHHRGRSLPTCHLGESRDGDGPAVQVAAPELTASWYAQQGEMQRDRETVLGDALFEMTERLREKLDFQTLMTVEALFYAHRRNRDVAEILGVSENQVALVKHRWIKQLRERVGDALAGWGGMADDEALDGLLSRVWEELRPSCPKRSTLGRYVLGSLDEPWREYIGFHTGTLGCRFCQANLEDLRQDQAPRAAWRERVFQSTVGFLKG